MQRNAKLTASFIVAITMLCVGRSLRAGERAPATRETNLPSPQQTQQLAREILRNQDLPEVLKKAKALIKTGFNAGEGYGEVWIRDLATFIELSCEVNDLAEIKRNLLMFFRFQGEDGNVIDGFIPKDKANVNYRYIRKPNIPNFLGHKNTVETDQESSLIQAVFTYVQSSGDHSILRETVDGQTVLARMECALEFLLNERFSEKHGLLWGATTADWGDVQPEHEWGVVLDENSHRAIDIYDNAMFMIAISNYVALEPKAKVRWNKVHQDISKNIRARLWDKRQQKFIPHIYLDGSPFPKDFDEQQLYYHGGTAVAIQAGLLSREEIAASLAQMVENVKKAGAPSIGLTIYPPYPVSFFKNPSMKPYGYQNGGDWTWFGGRLIQTLINHGFVEEAYRELLPMVARVQANDGFYEWYSVNNRPRGSGTFRGSAGVLGKAIEMLTTWAKVNVESRLLESPSHREGREATSGEGFVGDVNIDSTPVRSAPRPLDSSRPPREGGKSGSSPSEKTKLLEDPLSTLRQEHPRLLFLADDQQHVQDLAKTEALLARLIEQNQINATAMLNEPTVRYEIPDGKRLLTQSRECIRRVSTMAMAYRLSGDARFADGAINEMLVATKFKDWNPSHFLDTAEMTTALAIGYDWLYAVIKPVDREVIREAIVRLGLNEGKKVYEAGGWWTVRDNNWNQVCNGGMILGALAIADKERKLADEILLSALKSIPHGVSVYEPSGAYPEGPSYWQYGTSYTCLTIRGLLTALGTDFGLHQTPGLDRAGEFRIHTIGPIGAYFNYADCGVSSRLASAMFLLSDVYDQPTFAWWHRERLAEQLPANEPLESRRLDRFFPLEIAWYDARGRQPTETELPRDASFKSQQDVVTMRGSWNDANAIYVGFKGGDNQTNHGHLDIGSFVLDAQGVRWALDMGADNYNLPGFFGGRRWQYYRLINHSHNTIVINDQIQNPEAKCSVISFHSTPNRCGAIVDMTSAYMGQVDSARRGLEMIERRAIHVRDEITGASGNVRWAMVTGAEIKLAGNKALLHQDGKTLQAEILLPEGARFELLANKPPTKQERQNEGTRILSTRLTAGPDQTVEISIVLQPIDKGEKTVTIQPRPLHDWPSS